MGMFVIFVTLVQLSVCQKQQEVVPYHGYDVDEKNDGHDPGGEYVSVSCLPHTRGSTGNVAPLLDCCRSRPHAIRRVSVLFGGDLVSLFGSLAYVSVRRRSRVAVRLSSLRLCSAAISCRCSAL
jgi:hypothetical protein